MVVAACSWDVAFFFPVLRLLIVFAVNVAILGVYLPNPSGSITNRRLEQIGANDRY